MKHIFSNPVFMCLLAVLCISASFRLGLSTSPEVMPAQLVTAGTEELLGGDMNEDGFVDVQDAIIILEIARGFRQASPQQIQQDPDGDGFLSIDDALRILRDISL